MFSVNNLTDFFMVQVLNISFIMPSTTLGQGKMTQGVCPSVCLLRAQLENRKA